MKIDKELLDSFSEPYNDGGRQEIVNNVNLANEMALEHPILQMLSLMNTPEENNLLKVKSVSQVIAHANLYLKSVGETNYIHVKEINSLSEKIDNLEKFHGKSIDDILQEHEEEDDDE
jgi:hypothetical protein